MSEKKRARTTKKIRGVNSLIIAQQRNQVNSISLVGNDDLAFLEFDKHNDVDIHILRDKTKENVIIVIGSDDEKELIEFVSNADKDGVNSTINIKHDKTKENLLENVNERLLKIQSVAPDYELGKTLIEVLSDDWKENNLINGDERLLEIDKTIEVDGQPYTKITVLRDEILYEAVEQLKKDLTELDKKYKEITDEIQKVMYEKFDKLDKTDIYLQEQISYNFNVMMGKFTELDNKDIELDDKIKNLTSFVTEKFEVLDESIKEINEHLNQFEKTVIKEIENLNLKDENLQQQIDNLISDYTAKIFELETVDEEIKQSIKDLEQQTKDQIAQLKETDEDLRNEIENQVKEFTQKVKEIIVFGDNLKEHVETLKQNVIDLQNKDTEILEQIRLINEILLKFDVEQLSNNFDNIDMLLSRVNQRSTFDTVLENAFSMSNVSGLYAYRQALVDFFSYYLFNIYKGESYYIDNEKELNKMLSQYQTDLKELSNKVNRIIQNESVKYDINSEEYYVSSKIINILEKLEKNLNKRIDNLEKPTDYMGVLDNYQTLFNGLSGDFYSLVTNNDVLLYDDLLLYTKKEDMSYYLTDYNDKDKAFYGTGYVVYSFIKQAINDLKNKINSQYFLSGEEFDNEKFFEYQTNYNDLFEQYTKESNGQVTNSIYLNLVRRLEDYYTTVFKGACGEINILDNKTVKNINKIIDKKEKEYNEILSNEVETNGYLEDLIFKELKNIREEYSYYYQQNIKEIKELKDSFSVFGEGINKQLLEQNQKLTSDLSNHIIKHEQENNLNKSEISELKSEIRELKSEIELLKNK